MESLALRTSFRPSSAALRSAQVLSWVSFFWHHVTFLQVTLSLSPLEEQRSTEEHSWASLSSRRRTITTEDLSIGRERLKGVKKNFFDLNKTPGGSVLSWGTSRAQTFPRLQAGSISAMTRSGRMTQRWDLDFQTSLRASWCWSPVMRKRWKGTSVTNLETTLSWRNDGVAGDQYTRKSTPSRTGFSWCPTEPPSGWSGALSATKEQRNTLPADELPTFQLTRRQDPDLMTEWSSGDIGMGTDTKRATSVSPALYSDVFFSNKPLK